MVTRTTRHEAPICVTIIIEFSSSLLAAMQHWIMQAVLEMTAAKYRVDIYLAGPSEDWLNWEFLSRNSLRPSSSCKTLSRSPTATVLSNWNNIMFYS